MTTTEPIAFARGTDPLGRDVPLDHRGEVQLFGVPLVVESNAARVLELVEDLIGPVGPTRDPRAPMRMRVVLEPNRESATSATPVRWRVPDPDHELFTGPGMVASIDLAAGTGVMYVEERIVREDAGARFAHTVLNGPLQMLVTRRDRHPIHAAAIRAGTDDAALVLHGPSGAGKSTLCYVASRAGLDVLSDDSIRVERQPALRIWGGKRPGHVHLREDVLARLTEERERGPLRVRNTGHVKYVVSLPDGHAHRPQFAERGRVVLIDLERGTPGCERVSADEIVQTILSAPETTLDLYEAGRLPAAEALAAGGGWRLRLSNDPDDALPYLHAMLAQV
jgi:hypothetical protein